MLFIYLRYIDFYSFLFLLLFLALSLHSSDSISSDDEQIPSASAFEHGHSFSFTSSFMTPGHIDHVNNSSGKKKSYNANQHQEYQSFNHNRRRSSGDSSSHEHHKLTREDSERPIASEKIKKKSFAGEKDVNIVIIYSNT